MASAATARIQEFHPALFPREACEYAVKQLAIRAGVTRELFNSWHLSFGSDGFLTLFVQPGTTKQIRFPRATAKHWQDWQLGKSHTSTATWSGPTVPTQPNLDFKIPFSSILKNNVGPLFTRIAHDQFQCPVDLPVSVFLTLSRFEETLPHETDEHGRFSAFSSLAWRDNFLHRPVVDEYGPAFAQIVSALLPGWQPSPKKLRIKLGHDVDDIGRPFLLRSTLAHTLRRGHLRETLRDLAAVTGQSETAYEATLQSTIAAEQSINLSPTIYWKASLPGKHDRGYSTTTPQIRNFISELKNRNIAMGIHPSYATFQSRETLASEVTRVREFLNDQPFGSRQDYLRWDPATWSHLESVGLAYDASVGFADLVGFRAGTCHPYYPWLLSENRQSRLLEIPLLAMDTTLIGYMRFHPQQALDNLRDLVARCRAVGGVFSLAWHNTTWMNRGYTKIYKTLLQELAGTESYDWRSSRNGIN